MNTSTLVQVVRNGGMREAIWLKAATASVKRWFKRGRHARNELK